MIKENLTSIIKNTKNNKNKVNCNLKTKIITEII